MKNEQVVIETKMGRKELTAARLGDELIADIARYQSHPDCKTLWCFAYDPQGYIRNPSGLERDLSKPHGSMGVRVFILGGYILTGEMSNDLKHSRRVRQTMESALPGWVFE